MATGRPAQGPFTSLTWRSEHVTLRGPSPSQGLFTPLTWRLDCGTPWKGQAVPGGSPEGRAGGQGPFTPLTWRSDHLILRGRHPPSPPRIRAGRRYPLGANEARPPAGGAAAR